MRPLLYSPYLILIRAYLQKICYAKLWLTMSAGANLFAFADYLQEKMLEGAGEKLYRAQA
jgi:hypothetical protein